MGNYKIICFANQKGGVGKTTSALNIAACIARSGKRVLFIDSDPQGNATSGLGIVKRTITHSVYDLLIGRANWETTAINTNVRGLSLIPSSINLVGAELELVDEADREYRLRNALRGAEARFDYIIIDCPPSLGLITINSLTAAKYVVIPVLCEYYSLEGLSQLTTTIKHIKRLYNPNIELLGVLVNMFDGRLNLSIAVLEEIKRHFAGKLFRTPIPRSVKISEAPSHGMPITDYDRNGKGAAAYSAVALELMKRCESGGN
ncbi:MAG: ParA family protein [Clostridia bacterium]|nr:ParA family protein [Clostridia bacterium]